MGRLIDKTYVYWFGTSQHREPYKAYVPHTVHGWTPEIDAATLSRLQAATERIKALEALGADRPLRWCLHRTEAIASSHVEGIVTTLRSLSLLESLRVSRDPERVERDRQAIGAVRLNAYAAAVGARRSDPVTVDMLAEMHRRLFEATSQQIGSGEFRDEQNWIGSVAARTPAAAVYVPPPHQMVAVLLADLAGYVSTPATPPLAKAAVAHLQFETIHPFVDGNGRVGRALMHCVLQRDMPYSLPLPLSAAINERKDDYYASLRPYQTYIGPRLSDERSEAAATAVAYIVDAANVACDYTAAVVTVLAEMQQRWADLRLRRHSAATAVLAAMSTMPAVDTSFLATDTERSERAVRRAVRQLADSGVITESVDAETSRTVFELPEMLQIVDNRRRLVAACWDERRARADTDVAAVLKRWHQLIAEGTDTSSREQQRCMHMGVRSKVQCKLRAGHQSPHRYT